MSFTVAEIHYGVSQTVADAMISSWKRSRLSTVSTYLGFPRLNILAKFGMARSGRPPPLPDGELTDAEIVQKIVERMPVEIKRAFEARHLAIIAGKRRNGMLHRDRAKILCVPVRTYWYRIECGHRMISEEVVYFLDTLHTCTQNRSRCPK